MHHASELFLRTSGQKPVIGPVSRVHAYVLMNNHYHFPLGAPEANLAAGMKWFQGSAIHLPLPITGTNSADYVLAPIRPCRSIPKYCFTVYFHQSPIISLSQPVRAGIIGLRERPVPFAGAAIPATTNGF